jgi:hypothetical protein
MYIVRHLKCDFYRISSRLYTRTAQLEECFTLDKLMYLTIIGNISPNELSP